VIENVYVFPGLPAEMEAMFDAVAADFAGGPPIASWRRTYRTRESDIVELLAEATERWPDVLVGSYPRFDATGPEVTVVLKSSDTGALDDAVRFVEAGLG
jgi:molybdopterin-biosynthesis enzyme MoeA-like protein